MMRQMPRKKYVVVGAGIALAALVPLLISFLLEQHQKREAAAAYMEGVVLLKNQHRPSEGYWTGDIAELYRMGVIPRAMGEADSAPIRPLIDRPRPYHGYYFVAMETGPGPFWYESAEPLKQSARHENRYAYCAYPDDKGPPGRRIYLICPRGIFVKQAPQADTPQLRWPREIGTAESEWGIAR
jgi:hypothetical protein